MDVIIAMLKGNSTRIESLRAEVRQLDKDINLLKVQIGQLQDHEIIQKTPEEIKRLRVKDYVTGTSLGGAMVAGIEYLRAYFS